MIITITIKDTASDGVKVDMATNRGATKRHPDPVELTKAEKIAAWVERYLLNLSAQLAKQPSQPPKPINVEEIPLDDKRTAVSSCCKSIADASSNSAEGTQWYTCRKCGKPCDATP